ncbi:MAG: anthranilate phosphoribosyltransferase [Deltaproteobacteria bacterium]|nr:anthranilate phosphoribosyltransferase [Deltaproteobacteria bacterium]
MIRVQEILKRLCSGDILSRYESSELLRVVATEKIPQPFVVAFLTAFAMRLATVEELIGFRSAMLELATPIRLERADAIDVCGTGGDGKDTFNISTATAFVVAGAGVPVVKHGNHGFSSRCGSSTVLEALGIEFPVDEAGVNRDLERASIAFLHAPLFHPAMKSLAGIRRELGLRTVFNVLGPISNPARPAKQVVGVSDPALLALVCDVLDVSGSTAAVVYSLDGYDEISLTSNAVVQRPTGEQVLSPKDFGMSPVDAEELRGASSPDGNAELIEQVLGGSGSRSQEDVVIANSALAISVARAEMSITDAVLAARQSIRSGAAAGVLKTLRGGR